MFSFSLKPSCQLFRLAVIAEGEMLRTVTTKISGQDAEGSGQSSASQGLCSSAAPYGSTICNSLKMIDDCTTSVTSLPFNTDGCQTLFLNCS